jgi:hypothetical protein
MICGFKYRWRLHGNYPVESCKDSLANGKAEKEIITYKFVYCIPLLICNVQRALRMMYSIIKLAY